MGRPGLTMHRKFKRLARTLDGCIQAGFGTILARGVLEALWDPAFEAGDPYIGDATDVEARAGWGGRSGVLVEALTEAGGEGHAGFIEEGGSEFWPDGKAGTYRIHDLFDHAPKYVKRRVQLEEERRANGKTISAIRAEAGRKGAAKRWQGHSNREAAGEQPDTNERAGCHEAVANGTAKIPTPAPAPAPLSTSPAPDPAAEKWPLVAAVLAALLDRGFECFWPADEKTAAKAEQAIRTVGIPEAVSRVMVGVEDARARKVEPPAYLGWHVDAIAGRGLQPRQTKGDLGADLEPWYTRLTDEERQAVRGELRAIAPDLAEMPIGLTGDPTIHPVEAIAEINSKWRAVVEARS